MLPGQVGKGGLPLAVWVGCCRGPARGGRAGGIHTFKGRQACERRQAEGRAETRAQSQVITACGGTANCPAVPADAVGLVGTAGGCREARSTGMCAHDSCYSKW